MELFISLLGQLAATLSPTEFLVALSLVVLLMAVIIKWLTRHLARGRKGGFLSFFIEGGEGTDELKSIQTRLDDVMTVEEFQRLAAALNERAITANTAILEELKRINQRLEVITAEEKERHQVLRSAEEDLDDVKMGLKLDASNNIQSAAILKAEIVKVLDLLQRILSQVEKIDDLARTAIPEFRGYHKEISKELAEINKDIALVELSIQTQINTGAAVKLR